jgi:MYXO-CTERM domain-containing protein
MKLRRGLRTGLLGAALVWLGCSVDRGSSPVDASASTMSTLGESSAAAARIADLRTRFRALGVPVPLRFEGDGATHVRAVLPADALRAVPRSARVALPVRANDDVKVEDDTSHLSVGFSLEHVHNAPIELAGGMALYRGALDGADVVHRVHAEGTEDFVIFETRPAHEELSYSVDVSRAAGLRLVSNTLEFLDDSGTPVLRVAPPYIVDAKGERHEAKLAVAGCAFDTSPAAPWGRKVTVPGAARCSVHVAWASNITYPAMVDPVWSATGSMATARREHTASTLPSGRVLVVGGYSTSAPLSSAELYDPAGNAGAGTFAATGSMAVARYMHTGSVLPSGKVLISGGVIVSGGVLASAELYDPAGNAGAGTFVTTGAMGNARGSHTASVLPSGKVLVAGGYDAGQVAVTIAELFDPAGNAGAGTFSATGALITGRFGHTASVLPSGKVLIVGGIGGNATAELFDPAGNAGAGAFVATASMSTDRYDSAAAVLPSGKVLIAGGSFGNLLSSAELFDPAGNAGAGAFVGTGPMVTARSSFTASVLPTGKVLVAGGMGFNKILSSAEVFDPAGNAGAGTFVATGSLATTRAFNTATVLPSGKVLIAGGWAGASVYLASAEVFGGVVGDACTVGSYCFSGFCADGFCCNAACNAGGCDRCDVAGKEGTCSVASVGSPGADPTCALPYACDGVSPACPTSCTTAAQCAASYQCAPNHTCQLPYATCDGDHTTTGGDGTKQDCTPYKCDSNGACRIACTSVNDCVAPTICGVSGKCVAPTAGSDGGCAISMAGGDSSPGPWLAVVGLLALVSRRRRAV